MVQWVLIIWYVDGNLIWIANNCMLRTIRNLLEKQRHPQITVQKNKPQISFF